MNKKIIAKSKAQIKNKWFETKEDELDMSLNIIDELEQEVKKQKEVIDKIYELIKQHIRKDEFLELNEWQTRDLLKLLKEVSNE